MNDYTKEITQYKKCRFFFFVIEFFSLVVRVLEGLTHQYTPEDIFEDVFKHPKFDEFLSNVSSYPSSFIRSAVLQMVEASIHSKIQSLQKQK